MEEEEKGIGLMRNGDIVEKLKKIEEEKDWIIENYNRSGEGMGII